MFLFLHRLAYPNYLFRALKYAHKTEMSQNEDEIESVSMLSSHESRFWFAVKKRGVLMQIDVGILMSFMLDYKSCQEMQQLNSSMPRIAERLLKKPSTNYRVSHKKGSFYPRASLVISHQVFCVLCNKRARAEQSFTKRMSELEIFLLKMPDVHHTVVKNIVKTRIFASEASEAS